MIEIKNGLVYINGQMESVLYSDDYVFDYKYAWTYEWKYTEGDMTLSLGSGEYFLLGDNRTVSDDSRKFGAVNKDNIYGKVLIIIRTDE